MRPNQRLTADELMLAQVRRAQQLRAMPEHPDDDSMEIMVWVIVAGITWTFCLVLYWIG